jgi:hypothetical protein
MILTNEQKPVEPYKHQDYPALRYKASGEYKLVKDKAEDAAAESTGYGKIPPEPGVEAFPAPISVAKPVVKAAKK